MFWELFNNAFRFSLLEMKKISKLKMTIINCKLVTNTKENFVKNESKIIKIQDLKKTLYLKTPIIEKEWIAKLKSDILEGPKYLVPLIELISFKLIIFFFNVPEKLLHILAFSEMVFTSFFVKHE